MFCDINLEVCCYLEESGGGFVLWICVVLFGLLSGGRDVEYDVLCFLFFLFFDCVYYLVVNWGLGGGSGISDCLK